MILNSLHFPQISKAIALYLESNFTDFELTSFSVKVNGYSLIFGVTFSDFELTSFSAKIEDYRLIF